MRRRIGAVLFAAVLGLAGCGDDDGGGVTNIGDEGDHGSPSGSPSGAHSGSPSGTHSGSPSGTDSGSPSAP